MLSSGGHFFLGGGGAEGEKYSIRDTYFYIPYPSILGVRASSPFTPHPLLSATVAICTRCHVLECSMMQLISFKFASFEGEFLESSW